MKLTLKGAALIAAIETGFLPEIEQDGAEGYDEALFNRFWDSYTEMAEMRRRRATRKKLKLSSLKGIGMMAALESGMVHKVMLDGGESDDYGPFFRFWAMYNELAEQIANEPVKRKPKGGA